MIEVEYTRRFLRDYGKLPGALREEIKEKIALFQENQNHSMLRVHKLQGSLKGLYAFSVNYRYRIIFDYLDKKKRKLALITVGDHSIYE